MFLCHIPLLCLRGCGVLVVFFATFIDLVSQLYIWREYWVFIFLSPGDNIPEHVVSLFPVGYALRPGKDGPLTPLCLSDVTFLLQLMVCIGFWRKFFTTFHVLNGHLMSPLSCSGLWPPSGLGSPLLFVFFVMLGVVEEGRRVRQKA